MKYLAFLISILFLFCLQKGHTQQIPKDTIYLEFKVNKHNSLQKNQKFATQKGVKFNLQNNGALTFLKDYKQDTLSNVHLSKYPITSLNEINDLGKKWYQKNLTALQSKYGKIIAPFDNNGKFVTYLLEKHETYFILRRVYWRNQAVKGLKQF